jgi:hypothetical protein
MKRMKLVTHCFGVPFRTEINPRMFCTTEVTTNIDSDGGKKKGQCSVTDLRQQTGLRTEGQEGLMYSFGSPE